MSKSDAGQPNIRHVSPDVAKMVFRAHIGAIPEWHRPINPTLIYVTSKPDAKK